MPLTLVELHYLTLNHIAQRVDKLHIERLTDETRLKVRRSDDVGLIPNGVALIIAGIVEVEIHLLTRKIMGKALSLGQQTVESCSLSRYQQHREREQKNQE